MIALIFKEVQDMWRVRAEITGEFVVADNYRTFEEACDRYEEYKECGWYDEVDMWNLEVEE